VPESKPTILTLPPALPISRKAIVIRSSNFRWGKTRVHLVAETVQQILGGLVARFASRSGVLIGRDEFDFGMLFEHVQKTGFARLGAGRADRVAQQDDVAFPAQQPGEVFASQLAAFVIVGGDEAEVLLGIEAESMITTGLFA